LKIEVGGRKGCHKPANQGRKPKRPPININMQSASVVNHHLMCDPTIRQPVFDLPRQSWTLLNWFRMGQAPCHANLFKWGLAASELCDCRQRQTVSHIADSWSDGGRTRLNKGDDDWLKDTVASALAK